MRTFFLMLLAALLAGAAGAQITFKVTHTDAGAGWTDPVLGQARRDTLTAVFTYINSVVDATGTVDYTTNQSDYNATGPIASASTTFLPASNGFTSGNVFVHANTGNDPNGATADGTITVDWGYALSPGLGNPPPGQLDLFTILLHEVTHSMGFMSRIRPDGTSGVNNTDPGIFTLLDSFARIGSVAPATALLSAGGNFTASPADLSDNSPGIFFWGPSAMAATGGKALKLFQTSPHQLGSGLSHTGQLMAPGISNGDQFRTYSARDLGMLRDFGWKIRPQNPGFLGPKTITLLNDSASADFSLDLNEPGHHGRFRGATGGFPLDVDRVPHVWAEDPSTAASSRTSHYTSVGHPSLPGVIVLQNGTGDHSPTRLTWIASEENFRFPARPDEKMVFSFRAAHAPSLAAGDGTFLDVVLGDPEQAIPGGAERTAGIGLRIHASGPLAGQWELFDGTGQSTTPVAGAPFPQSKTTEAADDDLPSFAIELLEPSFDGTTSVIAVLRYDGEVLHTFETAGGIGDNHVSFHAGPSTTGGTATWILDDVNVSIEPWDDAPAVVTVSSSPLECAARRPCDVALVAEGGTAPYEWWIDGELPPGLSLADGRITGVPSQAGTWTVELSAVDYGFFVGKAQRTIRVIDGRKRPAIR